MMDFTKAVARIKAWEDALNSARNLLMSARINGSGVRGAHLRAAAILAETVTNQIAEALSRDDPSPVEAAPNVIHLIDEEDEEQEA